LFTVTLIMLRVRSVVAGVLIEGNGRMAVKRVGEWREKSEKRGKAGRKRGGETYKIGKGGSAVPRLPKWV